MQKKHCKTRNELTLSGDAFVHDINGFSYKISDLPKITESFPLSVFGFDEDSWFIKKTSIISVKQNESKNKFVRITTPNSYVDISPDNYTSIIRESKVIKVKASEIGVGDLIVSPKSLIFNKKIFTIRNLFSNRNPYKSLVKIRSGNKMHCADACMSDRFFLDLAFISGMLDCFGSVNKNTGDILFAHKNNFIVYIFCHFMSATFLTEPFVEKNVARLQNKAVAIIIDDFLKKIASQEDEIIASYISGYFNCEFYLGFFKEEKNSPYVCIKKSGELASDRLLKCLLIFGIIPFKSDKYYYILDIMGIETLLNIMSYNSKSIVEKVKNYISSISYEDIKMADMIGYRFGKELSRIKDIIPIEDIKYSISEFEKDNKIIDYLAAANLAYMAKDKLGYSNITKLVDSDIVGVKIIGVKEVFSDKAYEILTNEGCSLFINNVSCS